MNDIAQAQKVISQERSFSSKIPYSHHVSNDVIATKKGDFVTAIKLTGRAHITADIPDVMKWVNDLNTLLRSLPNDMREHFAFYVTVDRHKEEPLPPKRYDNTFCRELAEKYNSKFKDFNLLVNDIYLTIVFRPVISNVTSFFSKFEKMKMAERMEQQEGYIQRIGDVKGLIMNGLKAYEPLSLETYEHGGRVYCQMLEFFHYVATHTKSRIPITKQRYSEYLVNKRINFAKHGELGEIRHVDNTEYFGMLELMEYDDITVPGHFNSVLQADFELIFTQSFSIISKMAAKGYLKKHKRFLIDSEDVAISQIEDLDEALDQLESGKFLMGEHHATITTYADSPKKVKAQLQSISSDMSEVGVIPTMLDIALEAGYFAQLPANLALRPRPAVITSENFWSFNSLHNYITGKPHNNPWGDAITMLKSTSGSPYFFNFHSSPKHQNSLGKIYDGNCLVFGKTGSGKTTLMSFMLAQAMSVPNLRMVCFDKDKGMSVFIKALGGHYSSLETGKKTGLNPFQLEDTPTNRRFCMAFVKQLIKDDKLGLTLTEDEEIRKAVDTCFKFPRSDRRLGLLLQSLPNPRTDDTEARPSVNARLLKWTQKGELGWVFDNEKDELDVNKYRVYGFDITDFLEDAELRAPLIMYLTYRTQGMLDDANPFIYFFDEFWRLVEDDYFKWLFKNKLKTIRKEVGLCIFASQEPNDALASEIAKTMVSQCATQILLENPKADAADYVDGLKLTETELELLLEIPEQSRQMLIRQGEQSALVNFLLPDFDKEFLVLSGTPENAATVDEIIAQLGTDNPDVWLPEFYRRKGFEA